MHKTESKMLLFFGLVGSRLFSVIAEMHVTEDALSFDAAKLACELRNLSLLVAPTYEEYTMFQEELISYSAVPGEFWIGLHRSAGDDEFQWLTGEKLNVYWKHDGLKDPHQKRCVVADKDDAKWKTDHCSDQDEYYLCVNYTNSETDYKVYKDTPNYKTARKLCEEMGQDLAMIKNRHQYDALKNYLQQCDLDKDVWIGLESFGQDERDYRKFRWIDGDYMNTMDGTSEKMKQDNDEKCVVYTNGEWNTKSCNDQKNAICTDRYNRPEPEIMTNYYYQLKNRRPSTEPLKWLIFLSKSKCAAECSKSNNCYMYTYDNCPR